MRGHSLVGADLSQGAICRARREARQRNLSIEFRVADMRDLSSLPNGDFDVVLAADNALPHLLSPQDLVRAAQEITNKLRLNGLFLASIRDYDQPVEQHPAIQPAAFFRDGMHRRIYHQIWDRTDDRQYTAHVYITQETDVGWTSHHFVSGYRAHQRPEAAGRRRSPTTHYPCSTRLASSSV